MWDSPTYDCQQCGACCVTPKSCEGMAYAYLTREESKRMKRLRLSVVVESGESFLGARVYTGDQGSAVCVAFRGEVGESCGCSIYQDRPGVCRSFQAGSRECLAARHRAGLED